MRMQESACSVGAIHFEALVCNVIFRQTQIVKQRREINKLAVVLHLPLVADKLREPPCPVDMIEKRLRMGLLDESGRFADELRVRCNYASDDDRGLHMLSSKV
jgi:hypothetical protein